MIYTSPEISDAASLLWEKSTTCLERQVQLLHRSFASAFQMSSSYSKVLYIVKFSLQPNVLQLMYSFIFITYIAYHYSTSCQRATIIIIN